MSNLNLLFTGDVSFANIDHIRLSDGLKEIYVEADFAVGNLEAVITSASSKRSLHPYYLRSDKKHIDVLTCFSAFTLANNHILDYGIKGFEDTLKLLAENRIAYFGAGYTREQAESPFLCERDGFRIAIFGVSRWTHAGVFRKAGTAMPGSKGIRKKIAQLKLSGYFVVIMPHWGYEFIPYPPPADRRLARRWIDAGADVIIGSHSHELQGFEEYKGKFIFYSLGNFIFSGRDFPSNNDWRLQKSCMVRLKVSPDHSYSWSLIPYLSSDLTVELLEGQQAAMVLKYANEISAPLDFKKDEYKRIFYDKVMEIKRKRSFIRKEKSAPSYKNEWRWLKRLRMIIIKVKYFKKQDLGVLMYRMTQGQRKEEPVKH